MTNGPPCTHVCASQCDINIAIIIYVLSPCAPSCGRDAQNKPTRKPPPPAILCSRTSTLRRRDARERHKCISICTGRCQTLVGFSLLALYYKKKHTEVREEGITRRGRGFSWLQKAVVATLLQRDEINVFIKYVCTFGSIRYKHFRY